MLSSVLILICSSFPVARLLRLRSPLVIAPLALCTLPVHSAVRQKQPTGRSRVFRHTPYPSKSAPSRRCPPIYFAIHISKRLVPLIPVRLPAPSCLMIMSSSMEECAPSQLFVVIPQRSQFLHLFVQSFPRGEKVQGNTPKNCGCQRHPKKERVCHPEVFKYRQPRKKACPGHHNPGKDMPPIPLPPGIIETTTMPSEEKPIGVGIWGSAGFN